MGSKAGAKQLMAQAGVPVVPGYNGEDQADDTLAREAARTGFPLMIKAAHGGGGKGMRVVHDPAGFAAALESCRREARNAFGRDRVLLERYLASPRHIEVQVFGDGHGNLVHLGERECSAQRRYQKVLEESPSPFASPQLRRAMAEAAIAAARAIDYVNAGTVEFIVDADGSFYFMEINTRLQVEHPVTEMVTGLDLVEWQLRVAAGQPLPLAQQDIRARGHAIEVRLYAEDPDAGFLPASGRIDALRLPAPSPGVRVDAGVQAGDSVSVFYDPMIAKLVVHAADRPQALARLRQALAGCHVAGPKTNLPFLEALVRHPVVAEGRIDTGYLDRHLDQFLAAGRAVPPALLAAAAGAWLLRRQAPPAAARSPWHVADGWRVQGRAARRLKLRAGASTHLLLARGHGGRWDITIDGEADVAIAHARLDGTRLDLHIDGRGHRFTAWIDGDAVVLHDGTTRVPVQLLPPEQSTAAGEAASDGRVLAPMPGRIVTLLAQPGGQVAAGDPLLVMEAMKMELTVKAPRAGVVTGLGVGPGDFVEADSLLATVAPQAQDAAP